MTRRFRGVGPIAAAHGIAAPGGVDLIAAAHGTADPRGIREVRELVRMMARQRPDVPISLGFVDVDVPALPGLVAPCCC